jgi:hypothetical protein
VNKILNNYHLLAGIHTISIRTPEPLLVPEPYQKVVTSVSHNNQENPIHTSKLNLNKMTTDIYSYSEFQKQLKILLDSAGITEYEIVRADLRFDMFKPEEYEQNAKLHRYLISLLATCYQVKNAYKTTDLFSQKQLSVAIKNKYFECENYDKAAQSNGHDIAAGRLEIRSKCLRTTDLRTVFANAWFGRWEKALACKDKMIAKYNTELERIYKEGNGTSQVKFRSLTDFLIQYKACIFNRKQMTDLIIRVDDTVRNPTKRVSNFKQKYGIDFYTDADIRCAVDEIKRATIQYFNS